MRTRRSTARLRLLRAIVDGLGFDTFGLMGGSSGGCAAIAFAARFPERVDRLLLYGAYADGGSITSPGVGEAIVSTVRSHWGLGSRLLADIFLGEADSAEQQRLARYQRVAASPETAARLLELSYRIDVRPETGACARTDPGGAPSRRPRNPLRLGPRARRGDPGGDAHAPRWHRPFPLGGGFPVGGTGIAIGSRPRSPTRPCTGAPGGVAVGARARGAVVIAAGLSDQEVADHLFLSHHTVHRHVANIRRKLGRGSRAAAVAEAARLGLLRGA
jgi:pimeloyl-ACP methyl ester carboxylesterase